MAVGKLTGYTAGSPLTQTAIAGATLNGLTVSSYAYGAEFDNTANNYPYATLSLATSANVTGTAPSYLSFWLIEPDAAGNYVASSGNPGGFPVATFNCPSNVFRFSGRILVGRLMPPKGKIVMQNNLGTGGTLTADNAAVCTIEFFADNYV